MNESGSSFCCNLVRMNLVGIEAKKKWKKTEIKVTNYYQKTIFTFRNFEWYQIELTFFLLTNELKLL